MKQPFSVWPIQTSLFRAGDDLADFVVGHVAREYVEEKMVIAVTSKIVSLAEERFAPRELPKEKVVREEADVFLGEVGYGTFLTVKDGLLIPSAGIDESNSEGGDYILYPRNPFQSARLLWEKLRAKWGLNNLGILLTDSHTTPLRRGVTGICLSYWGFKGVKNLIGTEDLFGRPLRMTQMNLADGLSAAAVMLMGEGSERQPLALLKGAGVEFISEVDCTELLMPLREDLYYPLLQDRLGE